MNQGVVEGALRSGEFFFAPYGDATSPMLRQVITFNTHADQSTNRPVNGTLVAIPTATT